MVSFLTFLLQGWQDGRTALHFAARGGSSEVVELVLQRCDAALLNAKAEVWGDLSLFVWNCDRLLSEFLLAYPHYLYVYKTGCIV